MHKSNFYVHAAFPEVSFFGDKFARKPGLYRGGSGAIGHLRDVLRSARPSGRGRRVTSLKSVHQSRDRPASRSALSYRERHRCSAATGVGTQLHNKRHLAKYYVSPRPPPASANLGMALSQFLSYKSY
ncbi:hypothetical protein EVAR_23782_1 [Eumeta japonica]|uniref:Uncharacterized protein n=1 Tax=Eumeta variegata TaxID=151549 RepID=A0A4C1VHB4_EUMVA|nr:hypothetical protein EVAR_23782_1 [Eumeta japonica]